MLEQFPSLQKFPSWEVMLALALGVGLLGKSLQKIWNLLYRFASDDYIKTQGRVVGEEALQNEKSSTTYSPIVDYVGGAETYRIIGEFATDRRNEIGSMLPVIYPRERPDQGFINNYDQAWSGPLFGLIAAAICFAVAAYLYGIAF